MQPSVSSRQGSQTRSNQATSSAPEAEHALAALPLGEAGGARLVDGDGEAERRLRARRSECGELHPAQAPFQLLWPPELDAELGGGQLGAAGRALQRDDDGLVGAHVGGDEGRLGEHLLVDGPVPGLALDHHREAREAVALLGQDVDLVTRPRATLADDVAAGGIAARRQGTRDLRLQPTALVGAVLAPVTLTSDSRSPSPQ